MNLILFIFLPFVFGTSPPRPCPDRKRPEFEADGCVWALSKDFYGCDTFTLKCDSGVDKTCYQRAVRGSCEAYMDRWYFNPQLNRCVTFIYGGCGGNTNNFATQKDCEKRCPSSEVDPCSQKADRGTCNKLITRWYFSSKLNKCLSFQFTGCGGNGNNFVTKGNCENRCFRQSDDTTKCKTACSKCERCDVQTGSCVKDTSLPGCQRNPCSRVRCGTCQVCKVNKRQQPKCVHKPGCCPDGNPPQVRCFISPCHFADRECTQSKHCLTSYCTGCDAFYYDKLWNRIPKRKCKHAPPPPQTEGPCDNIHCGTCRKCVPTKRVCKRAPCVQYICHDIPNCKPNVTCANVDCKPGHTCKMVKSEPRCVVDRGLTQEHKVPTCSHLPDSGPCKAAHVRYHYDRVHSECKKFTYGGCMGNSNNFRSKDLCQSTCKGTAPCPIFKLAAPPKGCEYQYELNNETFCPTPKVFCPDDSKVKPGTCPAPASGRFGTCRSNCKSDADCKGDDKCCRNGCRAMACTPPAPSSDTVELCRQPKEPGDCRGSFTKYYFDSATGRCETFVYGGCDGNQNNFASMEKCQKVCGNVPSCPALRRIPSSDPFCKVAVGADGCPIHVCQTSPCAAVRCRRNSKCVVKNGKAKCTTIKTPKRCLLSKDSGPCEALVKLWYYNTNKKECLQFDYGGCKGNRNRFSSKARCEKICTRKQECLPPPLARPPKGCDYTSEDGPDGCPVFKLICGDKSGLCPKPLPNTAGICVEECSHDRECDQSMKCCSNGCGHSCISPIVRCPLRPIPVPPEGCYYDTNTGPNGCPEYKLICDITVEPAS